MDILERLHRGARRSDRNPAENNEAERSLAQEAAAEIARLRATLDAMTAERDAAGAKALEDALAAIAALPTGKSEDVMEGQEQAYDAIRALIAQEDKRLATCRNGCG